MSRSRFAETLDPADLTPLEQVAVELMTSLFVVVESAGGCFDVLVREAIERGERAAPAERVCSDCGRPWEDHYKPEMLKFKSGPFGVFGLKDGEHTPHIPGVHAEREA